MDSAGKGGNDREVIACAILGDGLAFLSVFLAWDLDGGFDGLSQGGEGGGERDGPSVAVPKGDVLTAKGMVLVVPPVRGRVYSPTQRR